MKNRKILLASSNLHKFNEMKKILSAYHIELKQAKIEIIESDLPSLEASAEDKAAKAFAQLKKPLIVEDTAIYFSAYKDFPGIYAKRMYLCLGFKGLLKLLEGEKNRNAYFKTCVCFFDGRIKKTFSGELHGTITEKVFDKNVNVLPYEKIFIPKGYSVTLSSISRDEKNTFSHRFKATKKFGEWFSARILEK